MSEYTFAKYSVPATPYVYSQDEYTRLLEGTSRVVTQIASIPNLPGSQDARWTKEETDYLFNLVRDYDGRFFVVHDRYEFPGRRERSLEVSRVITHKACVKTHLRIGVEGPVFQRMSKAGS